MANVVYILCALTSLTCAVLLARGFVNSRARLLLWSSLCFAALTVNNILLVTNKMIFTEVDLVEWRTGAALVGLVLLIGSRHLITRPLPLVGEVLPFPDNPLDLETNWWSLNVPAAPRRRPRPRAASSPRPQVRPASSARSRSTHRQQRSEQQEIQSHAR